MQLGKYFLKLSPTDNNPRSSRIRIAAAVNCFVIDHILNLVSVVFLTLCSILAYP